MARDSMSTKSYFGRVCPRRGLTATLTRRGLATGTRRRFVGGAQRRQLINGVFNSALVLCAVVLGESFVPSGKLSEVLDHLRGVESPRLDQRSDIAGLFPIALEFILGRKVIIG